MRHSVKCGLELIFLMGSATGTLSCSCESETTRVVYAGAPNGNGGASNGGSPSSGGEANDASVGGNNGQGGNDGGAGNDAGDPTEIPPPDVTQMTPESGSYGSVITVTGVGLGSAARNGVSLTLAGAEEEIALFPTSPEIIGWSEEEISFWFPFPQSGEVAVHTPQGSAVAGSFEPDWEAGLGSNLGVGASVLASLAPDAATIIAAFDTDPVRIIRSDGVTWTESSLDPTGVRIETLRLFMSASEVLAFALSDADPPEIVTFSEEEGTWIGAPSGVHATTTFALAGGPDGATIWSQAGSDWSRIRYAAGNWTADKGPIADPNPTGSNHAAGATSDGSLYIAWDQDTGNFLDDMGAPFMQQLEANASSFTATFRAGSSVDDFVTSITLRDRGRGLLVYYCGSDVDPFGLSATGYKCYTSAHSNGGARLLSGLNENETTRYGASRNQVLIGFCDDTGLHAALDPAAPGGAAVWLCPTVDALEIDPNGQPVFLIRVGDRMYAPHPKNTEGPAADAGSSQDGSTEDASVDAG
jgi:hypothetical protein